MTTTQIRTTPTDTGSTVPPRRPRTTLAVTVLAVLAAVLAVAVVVPWNFGSEPAAPPTPAPAAPPPAYQPGGSVHDQQVPRFQHWALVYGPDGSIYKSQVPLSR